MKIEFTIPGPPRPQKRHRNAKSGRMYNPSKQDKENAMEYASLHRPAEPLEGSLMLSVGFHIDVPLSYSEKKRKELEGTYVSKKPDLDNLIKLLLDVLESAQFFKNDSQVVALIAVKIYSKEPRTEIILEDI